MDKNNYFLMNPFQKFFYKTKRAIKNFPSALAGFFMAIGKGIARLFIGLGKGIKDYFAGFVKGNALTYGSYAIMGLGHMGRGQAAKGLIYLLVEILFVLYMVFFGAPYLGKFFYGFFTKGTVGITETADYWNDDLGIYEKIVGDNSFKIILYGILTIFMIFFFLAIYLRSIKESRELEEMAKDGRKALSFRKEVGELLNEKFHIPLLSLPMLGLFVFTVVPLVTMIIIAFTNYDASTEVPQHLFRWVGFANFRDIFGGNSALSGTFLRVLGWTLIWAFFATFSNYFGGMIVALLINKKGIRFKKLFRTIFVMTIAVPQFVSLMIVSKMLTAGDSMEMSGIITQILYKLFGFQLKFGINITHTRIAIILVNMWIGIPYSMLICSGILMNIPADLYESARIDG
ncbi:MAG: ABC transporter permease subunit, partial [Spirochaetales bacterium]|nr:ABC transporter permease subunit [Spirochaetales bacterium]